MAKQGASAAKDWDAGVKKTGGAARVFFPERCRVLAQGRKPSCHAGALLLIFLFLHSLLLPEMRVASKAVSHKADKFIAALGLR